MSFVITLTYREVFGLPIPKLDDLINKDSILLYLSILSKLNTDNFIETQNIKQQLENLKEILIRQDLSTKKHIINKIIELERKINGQPLTIFSRHINHYFYHFLLSNYKISPYKSEITIKEDLDFLKAYLIISQNINSNIELRNDTTSRIDYFRKCMWPIYAKQKEVNSINNIVTNFIKGKAFFNFASKDITLKGKINHYLSLYNVTKHDSYLWTIFSVIKNSLIDNKSFVIKTTVETNSFFEKISINENEYKKNYKTNKKNYEGLKSRPLVKFSDKVFIVIDWNFFSNKLLEGFFYDFYIESGLSKELIFKDLMDFKSYIGYNFIEKFLFRRIINLIFSKKYSVIKFDNRSIKSFPDAYVRIKNKIFLFEIKDSLFPSNAIENGKYEELKNVLDTKYNSIKKGTFQISNTINKISINSIEDNNYFELKINPRNFIIFPIIIYTDANFSTPGFMKYLQEEFSNQLKENCFKKINNLSFVHLDFLIENIEYLNSIGTIEDIIEIVFEEQKRKEKKFKRTNSTNDLHALNMNFEDMYYSSRKAKSSQINYVDFVFNEFDFLNNLLKNEWK